MASGAAAQRLRRIGRWLIRTSSARLQGAPTGLMISMYVKGGDPVLAPKLNQPATTRSLPAVAANPRGLTVAATRLRLRTWERRRAWAGRALIAISFPMAYLLMMLATGTPAPLAAVRIVIAAWTDGARGFPRLRRGGLASPLSPRGTADRTQRSRRP